MTSNLILLLEIVYGCRAVLFHPRNRATRRRRSLAAQEPRTGVDQNRRLVCIQLGGLEGLNATLSTPAVFERAQCPSCNLCEADNREVQEVPKKKFF
jgi:hypothetical protein